MPDRECEVCGETVEARWVFPCYRVDDKEKRPVHRVCSICYHRPRWVTNVGGEWVPTFVAVTEATADAYKASPFKKRRARAPRGAEPQSKKRKPTMAEKLLARS